MNEDIDVSIGSVTRASRGIKGVKMSKVIVSTRNDAPRPRNAIAVKLSLIIASQKNSKYLKNKFRV
jgi:hypothetical protein